MKRLKIYKNLITKDLKKKENSKTYQANFKR